jgi:hypothetical protein
MEAPPVFFRGAYDSGTTYVLHDLVSFGGAYYYSLTASNTGNQPDTHPASWQVVTVPQLGVIEKNVTLASLGFTSLFSVTLNGIPAAGGRVFYTIYATDGGSQIATEEGVIQWVCTAKAITCAVQTDDKLHLGTVNSGCTPGFFDPGSQPGVSIFDNVSFSTPASIATHVVSFRIQNDSGATIRLES